MVRFSALAIACFWSIPNDGSKGLRFDDILIEETPEMQEAIRRLSPKENDERNFRFKVR